MRHGAAWRFSGLHLRRPDLLHPIALPMGSGKVANLAFSSWYGGTTLRLTSVVIPPKDCEMRQRACRNDLTIVVTHTNCMKNAGQHSSHSVSGGDRTQGRKSVVSLGHQVQTEFH
jgi:hypothetical protein